MESLDPPNIILSCIWWKRNGLYVTGALLGMLLAGQMIYFQYDIRVDDYVRAFMLVVVSLIAVGLSETLAGTKKQLLDSEIRYRKIFETTGTAMAILEGNSIISLVNSEFVALSGYAKGELEHRKSLLDFVLQEEQERIRAFHHSRRIGPDGVPSRYEFTFVRRNSEERDVLAAGDMVPGTEQSVVSLSDITELKQTQPSPNNASRSFAPSHREFAAGGRTIPQVKVDQGLIRYTCVCGKLFEVFDGFLVKPDGDLFF